MSEEDKKRGLYTKYQIRKEDGSLVDPHAAYFVLRYDKDTVEGEAARTALAAYAALMSGAYPALALDLKNMVNHFERKARGETRVLFYVDVGAVPVEVIHEQIEELKKRVQALLATVHAPESQKDNP